MPLEKNRECLIDDGKEKEKTEKENCLKWLFKNRNL